jgi:DNA cross-link repair 1A protein
MSLPTSVSQPRCVPSKSTSKALRLLSSYPVPYRSKLPPISDIVPAPTPAPTKCLDAFSLLMSRNQENEAWKEAIEAENSKLTSSGKNRNQGRSKSGTKAEENEKPGMSNGRRHAPFYKVIQGMPIAVDAFRYGKIPCVEAYLLTCVLSPVEWAVKSNDY